MPSRPARRVLGRLVFTALALRLALFAAAASEPARFLGEPDSAEYLRLARNLTEGHGFSQAEAPPYVPDVRRTPVYPAAIAPAIAIPAAGVHAAILLGVAASVATVILLAIATTALFGQAAGRAAGLLLALDLTTAAYANQLLTESLFTLLVTASLAVLVDERIGVRLAGVGSGVLTGLAALCRPIGLFLAAAMWPACVWRGRPRLLYLSVIGAAALIIGGWMWRNASVAGVATVSSVAATNIYFHRAAYVEARLTHRPVDQVRAAWEREFEALAAGWTERQQAAWLNARGRALVFGHPVAYAAVWLAGVLRMFRPDDLVLPRLTGFGAGAAAWRMMALAGWIQVIGVYLLALRGGVTGLRRNARAAAVPIGLLVYFALLSGPEMYPRFRVPLMPAICMLAAVGWRGAAGVRCVPAGKRDDR